MLLEQRGVVLTGTYRYGTTQGTIEGSARGGVFRFRYAEPNETGTGVFRLLRPGKFAGHYTPRGAKTALRWEGHRGWDGLWETEFGRMRLVHGDFVVHGFYAGAGLSSVRGRAKNDTLSFRYRERNSCLIGLDRDRVLSGRAFAVSG